MLMYEPCKFIPTDYGNELVIASNGSRKFFNHGGELKWTRHKDKSKVFYVAIGKILLSYKANNDGVEQTILLPGMKIEIPVGTNYQMYAIEESHVYEFSNTVTGPKCCS